MKKILSCIFAIAVLLSLVGCGGTETNTNSEVQSETYVGMDMSIACIKGPTGVGLAKLMSEAKEGKTANNYEFTVANSPDEISGKIISGEYNIAAVPTNLAVKLYNKTEGQIKLLAVNTLGVLSVVTSNESIKSISDLKGKTIYSSGEGSNPEYILKYILKENGILDDVKINFVATNDELIAALVSGTAEVAMVPEPAATTVLSKKTDLKKTILINDEWEKVSDSSLMMGCVVTLSSFADEHKEQIDKFLSEYSDSVSFANKSTADAAKLCEEFQIVPSAQLAEKSIPDCNITFSSGNEVKKQIKGYFNVLFEANPSSLGGKLPNDDFYYDWK